MSTYILLGANGNSTNRYDNSTGETNFLKGPPPKTTLMDFMTKLKLTDDVKTTPDNHESSTTKDQRRRTHENSTTIDESNATSQTTTDSNEQIAFQQDEINDQVDSEDDPTHSNYRERRNPLPPRFVDLLFFFCPSLILKKTNQRSHSTRNITRKSD